MTEEEWLKCTDPLPMLEFLQGKASGRKWRLYLCGGCRRISHQFFRPWSLAAVEVAERFADRQATEQERHRAEWDAEAATFGYELDNQTWPCCHPSRMSVVPRLVEIGALPESALSGGEWEVDQPTRQILLGAATLADYSASIDAAADMRFWLSPISKVDWPGRWLLDCVFGNPFQPQSIDPDWFTWNNANIPNLAKMIYDKRAFDRMPVLADALKDAGCNDEPMLDHCRQPEFHVRGCWVLDLLLGKG
jgi:hypothetical protein